MPTPMAHRRLTPNAKTDTNCYLSEFLPTLTRLENGFRRFRVEFLSVTRSHFVRVRVHVLTLVLESLYVQHC